MGRKSRKPVDLSEAGGALRLRPRSSFALWRESVRGRSVARREDEKAAVRNLGLAITRLAEQHVDRTARIHRDFEAAHVDRDRYARATTHDLKDHVRGIHHLTTALRRSQGDALDEEGRQQLATILKLTQRMEQLVDALLDHSGKGQTDIAVVEVDLDALVDQALPAAGPRLADRNIEIRRLPRLGSASCNRDWIFEVFATLISNAERYNDKPDRWIEIGAEPGQPVRYFVRDNGVSIAAADWDLIFQMFHRVGGQDDQHKGAGIALALARKIIEHHGGRIWVQSETGAGATVYFTLSPPPSAET